MNEYLNADTIDNLPNLKTSSYRNLDFVKAFLNGDNPQPLEIHSLEVDPLDASVPFVIETGKDQDGYIEFTLKEYDPVTGEPLKIDTFYYVAFMGETFNKPGKVGFKSANQHLAFDFAKVALCMMVKEEEEKCDRAKL